ncbi:MAG: tetratricopeptide repeat protein [Acidobacteriota bacterium]
METTVVDWLPPLVVLAAAIAAGTLLAWRASVAARNVARNPEADSLDLRDLVGRREVLVQQLRELEDTSAKRTPEQLALERYALELETARVLAELETGSAALAPRRRKGGPGRAPDAAAESLRTGRHARHSFPWGATSVATVGLLVLLVFRFASPRDRGGSLTGETPRLSGAPSQTAGDASSVAEETQLKVAVARSPEDVEMRLELARVYLLKQNLNAAWSETQEALKRSPGDARALTYEGLIRLANGQPEVAIGLLKQAIANKPGLVEAHLQLAFAYVRLGRLPDAEATIAAASSRFPEKAATMSELLRRMREQVAQEKRSAAGSPPGAAGPGAQTRHVSGVVDLDVSLRGALSPGAVVWVTVREAGAERGPPVAVKRLPASTFPLAFSIGEADTMAGAPFPERVRIEARVDSDGDPTTRDPSDPFARLDRVSAGATNVILAMRRSSGDVPAKDFQ